MTHHDTEKRGNYMKTKMLLIASVLLTVSVGALASSCPIAPMTTYLGKGFTCTIGDRLYSNFSYSGHGTLGITAAKVLVTPVDINPSQTGFDFSSHWTTNNGAFSDSIIGYLATATGGTLITDAALSLGGGSFTGLANIDIIDRLCTSLTDHICTHPLPTDTGYLRLEAFMGPHLGIKLSDFLSFPGLQQLYVLKDIALTSSGRGGFAELSLVKQVAEPAELALLGFGLLALAYFVRKRSPQRST
jgi:hypothetical protein